MQIAEVRPCWLGFPSHESKEHTYGATHGMVRAVATTPMQRQGAAACLASFGQSWVSQRKLREFLNWK